MSKKPYINNRWIETHPAGFVIITPDKTTDTIPISCPVCQVLMRNKDDEISWEHFQCCHMCKLDWAESRKNEWLGGWRPSSEQIQEKFNSRPPIQINLSIDN